ncbi:MAG: S41 family peptidase [Gemmatimonadaceae bacterium]
MRYEIVFVSMCALTSLGAQQPVLRRIAPVDARVRAAVLDSIAHEMSRLYVDADTGQMIAARLRQRSSQHAYDQLTDPRMFADALTADLQSVNGDKHLYVAYAPGQSFDRPGAGGIVNDTGRVQRNTPQDDTAARRTHWDILNADVLRGNVGYLKIEGFEGSPAALKATSDALSYLDGTDAMIFDFRGMRGGSGEQSNFLISHFTGADTVPSLVVTNRSAGKRKVRYTLATVPGRKRPNVPIWILTDRGTASAGEDFAFVMKQMGRAKTVGDRTAGAGHNNDFVDVGNGFGVSISYTRVADPRTGKEWERVGVTPDINVDPAEALTAAHAAGLDSLSRATRDSAWGRSLRVASLAVTLQAHPRSVPVATLATYTGMYEGDRVVSMQDGGLTFRRPASRPPRPLLAVDDSTFVLSDIKVSFRRGPSGQMQMVQHLNDGSDFVIARLSAVPQMR